MLSNYCIYCGKRKLKIFCYWLDIYHDVISHIRNEIIEILFLKVKNINLFSINLLYFMVLLYFALIATKEKSVSKEFKYLFY